MTASWAYGLPSWVLILVLIAMIWLGWWWGQ